MALRKPSLSVQDARRLATDRPSLRDVESEDLDNLDEVALVNTTPANDQPSLLTDAIVATGTPPVEHTFQPLEPPVREARAPSPPPLVRQQSKAVPAVQSAEPLWAIDDVPLGPRVQVFVSAVVPMPGVSPSFDVLSRQYPPGKALQMILRRALDDYEEMLADGTYAGLAGSYLVDVAVPRPAIVQTSRIMPQALVDIARRHFDPLGFESTRAFGQKLASAALAAFFARERPDRS